MAEGNEPIRGKETVVAILRSANGKKKVITNKTSKRPWFSPSKR
jgi:hypothetical protein